MTSLSHSLRTGVTLACALPKAVATATWEGVFGSSHSPEEEANVTFSDKIGVQALSALFNNMQFPRDLPVLRTKAIEEGEAIAKSLGDRVVEYLGADRQLGGYWLLPQVGKENPGLLINSKAKCLTLLWLHGGGYGLGDPRQEFRFLSGLVDAVSSRLGSEIHFRILSLKYPLAPENPYPAGLNHVTAVYTNLLNSIQVETIVLGGHSAGGGLSLALCQKLRALGVPQPRALFLCSPYVEDSPKAPSFTTNSDRDCLNVHLVREFARCYTGTDESSADPMVAPVREVNFKGYPNYTCVYYGSYEVFRDDIVAWMHKAKEGGMDIDEVCVKGGSHMLPDSDRAKHIPQLVDFLAKVAASVESFNVQG